MIAFTPKNWHNTPSASTPISASALEDLETRVTDHANTQVAVIGETVDLDTSGATDEASALQTAIDNVQTQGGGVVLLPATNYSSGYIKIGSLIDIPQAVCLRGQGQRETRLLCSAAGAGLRFNYYDGVTTNTRGGECGGFHVDGNNTATTVMKVDKAVNRSFSNFRVSRCASSGIGLKTEAAQNCNFREFDIEVTNALSTGIKVTESSGSCRFSKYSIVGGDYAGIHVTQDTAGEQKGIGYPEPRYCTFDDGIVEHGDPATAAAFRLHSGRDIWVTRNVLCVATDVASSGAYNIVEINEDGQGDTVLPSFDLCSLQGGASPSKESTAFKISAPTNIRVRITNANFGNNSVGVDAGSGQTVACLDYRGPSVDTMFTGAGTILRREFGSTSITTS